jgi:CRP-like cAMP-binding protein
MSGAERSLPDELEVADQEALRASGHALGVAAGEAVLLEGDCSGRVMFVEPGTVRVSVARRDGDEVLLGFRGPGDILGEQAALDGLPHGQTVRAVSEARLVSIPREAFLELLLARPGLSPALHRLQVRRLREADALRVEQATVDVAGRLARRLAELRGVSGEAGLAISQQELANWVGASREAVTKGLAKLRRRGIVETKRGRIVVLDPEGLPVLRICCVTDYRSLRAVRPSSIEERSLGCRPGSERCRRRRRSGDRSKGPEVEGPGSSIQRPIRS